MGRLFARSLRASVRELTLFDYFGHGPRPVSLAKTIEDVTAGLEATIQVVNLAPPEADATGVEAGTWRLAPGPIDVRGSAGLAIVTERSSEVEAIPLPRCATRPIELVESCVAHDPSTGVIVAGRPEDAREFLPRADVILLALGFQDATSFAETTRFYAPWLRPGSLVVDLSSTKSQPMAILDRELPSGVGLLGAHPLFGPTVSELTGLIVAVVSPSDARAGSAWRGWFLAQLARLRMIVNPTSAAEHDDAMAFVQSLTHFALLAYAYTFVRLDRDPIDLLALRTPVFEPLLYLAARVAHLARTNQDTYRSIQTLSARPDARAAFLAAARDLLAAIEASPASPAADDPLAALFQRYGAPWSPEGHDRRDRQRREHLLEMGVRLVDNLNHLRQEVVAAVGQVRAVEEHRSGASPRVVIGVVALDLLDPGKQDVATRVRLRPLNLPLGSIRHAGKPTDDGAHDHLISLSRARLLDDAELVDWLYRTDQLVERRSFPLVVPDWFDRGVLVRLLKGASVDAAQGGQMATASPGGSRVWDVDVEAAPGRDASPGGSSVSLTLAIVVHPADLVAARRAIEQEGAEDHARSMQTLEAELDGVHRRIESARDPADRAALEKEKDRLKHERKAAIDRRTADVDREVRRFARRRVQDIGDATVAWLLVHGCEWGTGDGGLTHPPSPVP
jgi:prephenate dehydrogenase